MMLLETHLTGIGKTYLCLESSLEFKGEEDFVKLAEFIKSSRLEVEFSKDQSQGFCGGLVGYFSYESAYLFDDAFPRPKRSLAIPLLNFRFYHLWIEFDHALQTVSVGSVDKTYAQAQKKTKDFVKKFSSFSQKENFQNLNSHESSSVGFLPAYFLDEKDYKKAHQEIIKSIQKGLTYQVNFAHRLEFDQNCDSFHLYQKWMEKSHVGYGVFAPYEDFEIFSCSMERLLTKRENTLWATPIAGTRKKTKTSKDHQYKEELQKDTKENAEHAMLVDLARNDLGKISVCGSVQVKNYHEIRDYGYVFHIESDVVSECLPEKNLLELFGALFPGGTITGVPKVSTMNIISELEATNREAYTGSFGYFSLNQDMDFNIMIRTALRVKDKFYYSVGGGVTYLSNWEDEYKETWNKAASFREAYMSIAKSL